MNGLPERDASRPITEQGLHRKYQVSRTDGSDAPGGKHDGCDYFVLDITHEPHAREAASAYADSVEATHPELAADMRARYGLSPSQLAEQRAALMDALQNMIGAFDTPVRRRKFKNDFGDEACETARAAIALAQGDAA